MIRYDMTVAGKFVVPVVILDLLPRVAPVREFRAPGPHVGDETGDQRIAGNDRQTHVDQMIDIGAEEGLGLHSRQQFGGVDRLAVMAHAACGFGEFGRQPRLARRDQRPSVDEDLRPDLFGDRLPVGRDRTRKRRLDAAFEVQPGRMLGRIAVAAPPQDRSALDDRVEPRLTDLLRREVRCDSVLGQRAHKGECARHIVVGDHERRIEAVMDVIFDRSELLHYALVGPPFEWPADIDADQLAEDAGVDAFEIVGGNSGHRRRFP